MSDKDRSMLDERLKRTTVSLKADVPAPKKPEPKPETKTAAPRRTVLLKPSGGQMPSEDDLVSDAGSAPEETKGRVSIASSSGSEGSEKTAAVAAQERPTSGLLRPGTVTLKRAPPQLIAIPPEQLALAMENVAVPPPRYLSGSK